MIIHVVEPGDTVVGIARRYGVSPSRIISDNAISGDLVVGQALIILFPETVHTVAPGDTLSSIARTYGISIYELIQNNPYLAEDPTIRPGDTLVIRFSEPKRRSVRFNAYAYPFINRSVLLRALPFLTYLTIFGYGFTTDGSLIEIDDDPLIELAYQFGTAPVMLLSSITESGGFSSARASLLFNDLELQNTVLDNVVAVMLEKDYVGLDLDFEYIPAADRNAFTAFVQNAVNRLSPYGFFVNTDLAPKTSDTQAGLLYEAHDYGALGAASDTVFLMTYEWGYTYGPPMAVAPLNRVREVVEYAVTEIPTEKIFLGIPNYGYDWPLPFIEGTTRAQSIGNQTAIDIARRNGAEVQFDPIAMSPFIEYTNAGVNHIVWFEDVRSILAKFDLMDEFNLRGAGYWNAMRPFAQNFALISALYNVEKVV